MSDDIVITFSADVSDLQSRLQQAASTMDSTIGSLRNGANQLNASFGSLTQAYAAQAARQTSAMRAASGDELVIARQTEQSRRALALSGLREQATSVRQQAQLAQISRQDELTSLLTLENRRVDVERNYLQFLAGSYRQGTSAYAATQHRLEELTSQSALRRQAIERETSAQVFRDYRRSFDQIGGSVTRSIMGMIQGTMSLRDAARNILLQVIQSFVQARIRMVADWLAGVAAQTAATTAGEATKTAAVSAGTSARTSLESTAAASSGLGIISGILKSIFASAAQTFAGIFGFLSPIMGPAAAGPALAGQATVLGVASGLASFAVGSWELPGDMIAQVHKGEMIVPAGPAAAWRSALDNGPLGEKGKATVHHSTNINVNAVDAQSVKRFLKNHDRTIMRTISEGVRTGAHLGLGKLGGGA
jgi:hypothetical protein